MRNVIPDSVFQSGVPLGTGGRPISRIRKPLLRLLDSRRLATLRIVLFEICMMLRRTGLALRAMSHMVETVDALVDPEPGMSPLAIRHACNAGIQKLRQGPNRLVFGWLDCRLYSQGFVDGARWMWSNKDTIPPGECPLMSQQKPSGESIR